MKESSVAEQLETLAAPKPRAEARLAARNAAVVEFARVNARPELARVPGDGAQPELPARPVRQGFWSRLRLSRNDKRDGSPRMRWRVVSRTAFGAVASGSIAAFAIAVMWPMFRDGSETTTLLPQEYEATVDLQRHGRQAEIPKAVGAPLRSEPDARPTQPAASRKVAGASVRESKSLPMPSFRSRPVADPYTYSTDNEVVVTGERRAMQSAQGTPVAVNDVNAMSLEPMGASSPADQRIAQSSFTVSPLKLKAELAKQNASGGLVRTAPEQASPPYFEAEGDDRFQHFELNPIRRVSEEPVSTFSVDVDTASYSFARRMIKEGRLPQKDAVRVEEMINYFDYAWPKPGSRATPFAATVMVGDSPWAKGKKLVHIGIKGYDIDRDSAPDSNLVFLMDVSGSMNSPDKLPLAVQSMKLLLHKLKPTDTVSIVVYAGAAGTVLEPTAVKDEDRILKALDALQAGGSTAGAEGIELAYQLAEKSFRKGGVNRVMLATDGDFNVGIDDTEELKSFIERKREKGIFLSVLGFGEGNYRDELAQALAQNGNGVAAYIDTINEARKVLVEQATGSLFTIAKDVKLQVEFNPKTVAEYRLVGYETRALKREDFNNDRIDAGDVGAGHTVTALYEITPVGSSAVSVDALRYQPGDEFDRGIIAGNRSEYGFLKIRYKLPTEDTSKLISQPIPLDTPDVSRLVKREADFATAVAGFAQLLKGGQFTGKLTYEDVMEQAKAARGEDRNGYRAEFVELVREATKAKGM
jgi:Ca-activated chloride channel homolog